MAEVEGQSGPEPGAGGVALLVEPELHGRLCRQNLGALLVAEQTTHLFQDLTPVLDLEQKF